MITFVVGIKQQSMKLEFDQLAKHLPFNVKYKPNFESDILHDHYADFSHTCINYNEAIAIEEPFAVKVSNAFIEINDMVIAKEDETYLLGNGEMLGACVDDVYLSEVKPILHQLSYFYNKPYFGMISTTDTVDNLHVWQYKRLLEHHCDVDGLIGQGLAIDAATLTVDPYKI